MKSTCKRLGSRFSVQVRDFTDDPQLQERFCEAYRAHNKTVHDQMIKAFPGTVEALGKLASAGLNLGVVTSKRHEVAWHGLEVVGAAQYLDCCVGWDDVESQARSAAGAARLRNTRLRAS